MKTLAWVLVILNQSEVITDGELLYPSLQKCEMYEKKVNRPLQKIQRYTYSAYCRPEVIDRCYKSLNISNTSNGGQNRVRP